MIPTKETLEIHSILTEQFGGTKGVRDIVFIADRKAFLRLQ